MQIIEKNIKELIPYEKNPRRNNEAVKYVAESIKSFGFKVPIVIDTHNVIVAGHTRYKASKKLKLETVPCIIADDLTDQQIKAYRLADNKVAEHAEWDFDLLNGELTGLLDIDMSAFGFGDEEEPESDVTEDDDFEAVLPEVPRSKVGDLYQLGAHRLLCGDSTNPMDMMRLMDGQLADLIVTDPPYNVNYTEKVEADIDGKTAYKNDTRESSQILNDNMGDREFYAFLLDTFSTAEAVTRPGGVIYVWHSEFERANFTQAVKDAGFKVSQTIIWVKQSLNLTRQDYQWIHEPCLYGWKEGAGHYFIDDRKQTTVIEDKALEINKLSKDEMRALLKEIYSDKTSTSVIHEDKPHKADLHPTMKPLKLLERLIKNSSKQGELVLDSFGGSGSTLMTCEQLNRRCAMMELDPHYVDVIIDRWESFTGKKAKKIKS